MFYQLVRNHHRQKNEKYDIIQISIYLIFFSFSVVVMIQQDYQLLMKKLIIMIMEQILKVVGKKNVCFL